MSTQTLNNEHQTRAAVVWWLGKRDPFVKPNTALHRLEGIMKEKGDEYNQAITAYNDHLAQSNRSGVGLSEPEKPEPPPPPKPLTPVERFHARRAKQAQAPKPTPETKTVIKPKRAVKSEKVKDLLELKAFASGVEAVADALMKVAPELQVEVLDFVRNTLEASP